MSGIYAGIRAFSDKKGHESYYNTAVSPSWFGIDTIKLEKNALKIANKLSPAQVHNISLPDYNKVVYAYRRGGNIAILLCKKEFEDSRDVHGLLLNMLESHLILKNIITNPDEFKRTKIAAVKEKLGEVKSTMFANAQKMLERGEKLEHLIEQSEDLKEAAELFNDTAKSLNSFWCSRCTIM